MGMNEENVDKSQGIYLQQTLHGLADMVAEAARSREGSFSQRNPMLGKMVRCPHCHRRRRQSQQDSCCNPNYMARAMQVDEDGNETVPMTPKQKGRKNPRLTRHIPPLFLMRQRLLELESEGDLMALKVAVMQDDACGQVHGGMNQKTKWGHTPQTEIKPQHYAAFIEKLIIRDFKLSVKRKRKIQKESRRVNRA
jgi:hypothetical protein